MRKRQQSRPYTVLSSDKVLQSELAFIENLPCAVCQQSCEIVLLLVQSLSCVWLFAIPCQASLPFTVSWSLLKLMSVEPVMSSNHLILCHPLLSCCLQSFPASGSFPMSRLFTAGGQSVGASASVPPNTTQGWFPLGLIGLIPLQSKGLSRVFSSTTVQKHEFFSTSQSNSHIHTWPLEKP